jgi:hypothetical protein
LKSLKSIRFSQGVISVDQPKPQTLQSFVEND